MRRTSNRGLIIFLSVITVIAVLAAVFCGLYFGVPEVHDFFTNLVKPETVEPVEETIETTASLLL